MAVENPLHYPRADSARRPPENAMKPLLRFFYFVSSGLGLLSAPPIHAAIPTEQEIRRLPLACKFQSNTSHGQPTFGRTSEQMNQDHNKWLKMLGPGFNHYHHFCWGQTTVNRYYSSFGTPPTERNSLLKYAIEDYNYSIERSPPDFSLLPEILVARAKAYVLLKETVKAIPDLQRAIKLNPKYEKAYADLAEIYAKDGQPEIAKKIIQTGLQLSPNSPILTRRAARLNAEAKRASGSGTTPKPDTQHTGSGSPPENTQKNTPGGPKANP